MNNANVYYIVFSDKHNDIIIRTKYIIIDTFMTDTSKSVKCLYNNYCNINIRDFLIRSEKYKSFTKFYNNF